LLGAIRAGHVRAGEVAVFVHTGGLPALFAYADAVMALPDDGAQASGQSRQGVVTSRPA
jgi:hypothetical protein